MGLLDELLGGGQLQKEYKDFVDRYEQGDPSDGYSDQEVLKRYGEVAHAVPRAMRKIWVTRSIRRRGEPTF